MCDAKEWAVGDLVLVHNVNLPARLVWRISGECHDEDGAAYILQRGPFQTWARAESLEAAPHDAAALPTVDWKPEVA